MYQFTKSVAEKHAFDVDFTLALPPGVTSLSSGTAAGYLAGERGIFTADNTVLTSTTCTVVGNALRVAVKSGVNNRQYKIILTATFNDGSIIEYPLQMNVRNN